MAQTLKELKATIYRNPYAFQTGFDKWLERNYATFIMVRDLALRTRKKATSYGIATLWEVARHHSFISDKVKALELDNSYRTDVALLLMMTETRLANFFQIRKRTMRTGCFGPQMDLLYPKEDQLETA